MYRKNRTSRVDFMLTSRNKTLLLVQLLKLLGIIREINIQETIRIADRINSTQERHYFYDL